MLRSGVIDSITPSLVVDFAFGSMGDYVTDQLKRLNIPIISTLKVGRLVEEWEADKMGMSGGRLSKSIAIPEIDGVIRPYALFANFVDENGFQYSDAIPERLDELVETANNYIKLQNKPNKDKRVVIYYFKGPGQNAMKASGMEVVPSLYNLLSRMREEGYNVDWYEQRCPHGNGQRTRCLLQ